MEFDKLTLFSAVKGRLKWLTERQEVLAQNIANADTPRYKASDLDPFEFRDILRRERAHVRMAVTDTSHQPGVRRRIRDFAEREERHPYETSPNGNSVVLEEQLAKVSETHSKHQLATRLYKKHLNMITTAVRGIR